MSDEWSGARIAELRADLHDRTDVYTGEYVLQAAAFRSLLDALESARAERDGMRSEIICLRAELAEYYSTFGP